MPYSYHDSSLPHVVVVGAGFGGLELIKSLRNKPFRVTLFDQNNYFTFQPLLYQVASGGLGPDAIAYPLRKIIGSMPNVAFRLAKVERVDAAAQRIYTSIGEFDFDYLVIATGAQSNFFGKQELAENSWELKSIDDALELRSAVLQQLEKAVSEQQITNVDTYLDFVVVGGGPTGVETAGALAEIKKHVLPADYKELEASRMKVHLVEASARLLGSFSEKSSEKARLFLEEMGVDVKTGTSVQSYNGSILELSNGEKIKTSTVIWAAGVKGKGIEGLSVTLSRNNRYPVNTCNQVDGYTRIFAIGDVAQIGGDVAYPNGHPMVAQPAMQQARHLAGNLQRLQAGSPMVPFIYKDLGSMATIGRHKAVFEGFGIKMQGFLAWMGWMALHLMTLVGFRNRLVALLNWTWNYFSYQGAIRLITRPLSRKNQKH